MSQRHRWAPIWPTILGVAVAFAPAGIDTLATAAAVPTSPAQVDQELAARYFAEAAALCEREGGRLWGVSLCGPMVFADAATGTIATSEPPPDAERPRSLGFANTAIQWGDQRWATYVWRFMPADDAHARGRLMMHELFHRVQARLGLMTANGRNDHLDTLEGRYWLQLEWRALAAALRATGPARSSAVRDALAFRASRHRRFPGAAESERLEEVREGLAQYTGTVAATASRSEAVASALGQLARAPEQATFVRTAAYTSGTAYGLLLDLWSPGWTRDVASESDLAEMLAGAADIDAAADPAAAADRYAGTELRAAEEVRETQRRLRVAELRRRFVDGPVLVVPRGTNASFVTTGSTPIPGAGTTLANYRVTGRWGSLEAETILVANDDATLVLPAPEEPSGTPLTGDGWTLELAPGWVLQPGPRDGDFQVVRADQQPARSALRPIGG